MKKNYGLSDFLGDMIEVFQVLWILIRCCLCLLGERITRRKSKFLEDLRRRDNLKSGGV
jgi:hypothetical protein